MRECLQLLDWLAPTPEAHRRRMAVFQFIRSVVSDCFGPGAKTVLIGSCALKTYLPDADIDMSVFVPRSYNQAADPVASLTAHICKAMQEQQAARAASRLNTMVTCLLNTHDVRHPFQAFILFFKDRSHACVSHQLIAILWQHTNSDGCESIVSVNRRRFVPCRYLLILTGIVFT